MHTHGGCKGCQAWSHTLSRSGSKLLPGSEPEASRGLQPGGCGPYQSEAPRNLGDSTPWTKASRVELRGRRCLCVKSLVLGALRAAEVLSFFQPPNVPAALPLKAWNPLAIRAVPRSDHDLPGRGSGAGRALFCCRGAVPCPHDGWGFLGEAAILMGISAATPTAPGRRVCWALSLDLSPLHQPKDPPWSSRGEGGTPVGSHLQTVVISLRT